MEPTCDCGHNLEYEGMAGWLDTRKIRRACPVCGQAFRPQHQLAEIRNGEDRTIFVQPGGLCKHFAIIIDFGKDMPFYRLEPNGVLVDAITKVTDVFLQTCITALGGEVLIDFSNWPRAVDHRNAAKSAASRGTLGVLRMSPRRQPVTLRRHSPGWMALKPCSNR